MTCDHCGGAMRLVDRGWTKRYRCPDCLSEVYEWDEWDS